LEISRSRIAVAILDFIFEIVDAEKSLDTPYITRYILAEIVLGDSNFSIPYLPIAERESKIKPHFCYCFYLFLLSMTR
jgi:hypothetical protein